MKNSQERVFLRRGYEVEKKFPTILLVPKIKNGELIGTDEISPNGTTWIKLNKYPHLNPLFRTQENDIVTPKGSKRITPALNKPGTTRLTVKKLVNEKAAVWSIRVASLLALHSAISTFLFEVSKGNLHLFDVFFLFGLAFGIYKRSRVCAVLMLVYFISSKVMQFLEPSSLTTMQICVSLLLFTGYAWGVVGTFILRKAKNA